MGYDRIAGKDTAGTTVEDGPTDYVHRDDVIGVVSTLIEKKVRNRFQCTSVLKQTYVQNHVLRRKIRKKKLNKLLINRI